MKFSHGLCLSAIVGIICLPFLSKRMEDKSFDIAIQAFKTKKLAADFHHLETDPYSAMTEERLALIEATLNNPDYVCALKYLDEGKEHYTL